MQTTNINWTDKVWNPVTGCTKISAGCKNCYAETIANRFWKDRKFTDVLLHPERLSQIGKLKKPSTIFVNSMSDLFHPDVPLNFIDKVLVTMVTNPRHTYQVLTKRPDRLLQWCNHQNEKIKRFGFDCVNGKYFELPNFIWLGVSVENQKTAEERIPLLLEVPAKFRWLSIEPLIEPIDLSRVTDFIQYDSKIDWVVIGCESGPKRRECKIEWIEDLVDQCKSANVPVWVKQININGKVVEDVNQFPKHLQVRELPNRCG